VSRTLIVAIAVVALAAVGGGAFWAGTGSVRIGLCRTGPSSSSSAQAGRQASSQDYALRGCPGLRKVSRGRGSSGERAVEQAEADLLSAEEALAKAETPYTEMDLRRAELDVAQAEVG